MQYRIVQNVGYSDKFVSIECAGKVAVLCYVINTAGPLSVMARQPIKPERADDTRVRYSWPIVGTVSAEGGFYNAVLSALESCAIVLGSEFWT